MLSFCRDGGLKVGAVILSFGLVGASCATLPRRERPRIGSDCEFVVYNRTGHALEIRLLRKRATTPVGALNPGELLSESISCGEKRVWIGGIAIPAQVGAPIDVGYVLGWADLVRGERAIVSLHRP
jgi:hypothetical protein